MARPYYWSRMTHYRNLIGRGQTNNESMVKHVVIQTNERHAVTLSLCMMRVISFVLIFLFVPIIRPFTMLCRGVERTQSRFESSTYECRGSREIE